MKLTRLAIVIASPMLLASTAALAQTSATTPATPPAAAAPAGSQFYSHRDADMRASKLIGANITNAANETIGEINDVVLNSDGKVAAVVVGVGGFLGLGQREVALDYSALKFSKDSNSRDVVTVNVTKEQLKNAPAWTWPAAASNTAPAPAKPATTPAR